MVLVSSKSTIMLGQSCASVGPMLCPSLVGWVPRPLTHLQVAGRRVLDVDPGAVAHVAHVACALDMQLLRVYPSAPSIGCCALSTPVADVEHPVAVSFTLVGGSVEFGRVLLLFWTRTGQRRSP